MDFGGARGYKMYTYQIYVYVYSRLKKNQCIKLDNTEERWKLSLKRFQARDAENGLSPPLSRINIKPLGKAIATTDINVWGGEFISRDLSPYVIWRLPLFKYALQVHTVASTSNVYPVSRVT